jgi:phosphoglycerol transferase MdoB-like AlkP superfamily enzyme
MKTLRRRSARRDRAGDTSASLWASLLLAILTSLIAFTPLRAENRAEYDLEVVSHSTPSTIRANSIATLPLTLRNDGSISWLPGDAFFVSYHWLAADGSVVVQDGIRTPLPYEVRTGMEVTVDAQVNVPNVSGTHRLQWDVVREGVCWISERDPTPASGQDVFVEASKPSHALTVVESETPSVLWTNQQLRVRLVIRNDGAEAWSDGLPINVAFHWSRPDSTSVIFEGDRTALSGNVSPGDEVEVDAFLRTPLTPGRYRLQWDMVHEGVTWFAQRDPTPEQPIDVTVLPRPEAALHGSFVMALACLTVIMLSARGRGGAAMKRAASMADVLWLLAAIVLKQGIVLQEAPQTQTPLSYLLILAGASAVAMLVLPLPTRIRPVLSWLLNAGTSFVILVDLVHQRYFGDVISMASIGSAGQAGDVIRSFLSLLAARDGWLLADLLPGLAIVYLVRRTGDVAAGLRLRIGLALLAVTIASSATWLLVSSKDERFHEQVFKNAFVVRDIGIVNFHLWDALHHARDNMFERELSEDEREEVLQWFREQAPRRAGAGPLFGAASGMNLLMIQVESLQGFVVGFEVGGREITPNLNRWQEQSIWFSSCIDQTAKGRTSDGELLTQVSLLPPPRGAAAFRFASNRYTGLAAILAEAGYDTLSAVPFDGSFWNRNVTHPAWGYRRSLFVDDFEPGIVIGWGLNDHDFLDQMLPRLSSLDQPFAAFLITLSNHHPFEGFPSELENLDLGSLQGTPTGNYLHAMNFFDRAFGRFLEGLEASGLLDNTIVVLWGDHASGLEWDEEFARTVGVPFSEPSYYLTDRVPLMIRLPVALEQSGGRHQRSGLVDVAPTLLALLGVDPDPYAFVGRNLLGNASQRPVTQRYGSWLDDERIYLTTGELLREGHCFDAREMTVVPLDQCREGNAAAKRMMRVSRDVLRHDLQLDLHLDLSGK